MDNHHFQNGLPEGSNHNQQRFFFLWTTDGLRWTTTGITEATSVSKRNADFSRGHCDIAPPKR